MKRTFASRTFAARNFRARTLRAQDDGGGGGADDSNRDIIRVSASIVRSVSKTARIARTKSLTTER